MFPGMGPPVCTCPKLEKPKCARQNVHSLRALPWGSRHWVLQNGRGSVRVVICCVAHTRATLRPPRPCTGRNRGLPEVARGAFSRGEPAFLGSYVLGVVSRPRMSPAVLPRGASMGSVDTGPARACCPSRGCAAGIKAAALDVGSNIPGGEGCSYPVSPSTP